MKHFIKEYAVELASAVLIIIGIFLVVNFTLRDSILSALGKGINTVIGTMKQVPSDINSRAAGLSTSEVLGGLLILLAVGFIIWRIRYRFQTDQRWETDFCPKCSSLIMRVHRNLWDRILGVTLLPDARRYRCVDPKCGWSGLLRRHLHRRRHRSEPVSGPQNP